MKRLFVIAPFLMLVGCVTVPVTQTFPKAPDTLMETPQDLKEVPAGAAADQVFEVVIENYGTYYEVSNKLKGWQQWYIDQKKIFDSVK